MQTRFKEGRLNYLSTTKLLSIKNGKVVISTLHDAMIFGETQGLYCYRNTTYSHWVDYALALAGLMKQHDRNKLGSSRILGGVTHFMQIIL